MYFIRQNGENDCAFACLSMLLAYYHHDKNYLFLKHEDKKYSFKDLIDIGHLYSTNLMGIKVSNEELLKSQKFPFIVTLKVGEGVRHSVIVTKVTRHKVMVIDPAFGKKSIPYELFISKWSNHVLVVDTFVKTKCPVTTPSFISKKDKITLPMWQLLSGLSILIGTYFINQQALFYVTATFLAFFIIFELMFRDNLIKAMRRVDENIANYTLDIHEGGYYDFYVNQEKYRKLSLSIIPNFIYAVILTVFITFILLVNSVWNSFYILLAFIIALFDLVFSESFFKKKEDEIKEKEAMIKSATSEFEYQHFSRATKEEAYKYGSVKTLFVYLEIALILAFSILIMKFTSTFSLTYLLFNIVIVYFLKGQMYQLLNYDNTVNEYNSCKNKIINSLK